MKMKNEKIKNKNSDRKISRLSRITYSLVMVTVGIFVSMILWLQTIHIEDEQFGDEYEFQPTYCPEDSPTYSFPLMVTDLDGQPLSGISIMPMPESGGCIRTLSYLETDENGEATITSYSDESFSFLIQNTTCSPQHHTLELRSENDQVCIVNDNQCNQWVMIQIECE